LILGFLVNGLDWLSKTIQEIFSLTTLFLVNGLDWLSKTSSVRTLAVLTPIIGFPKSIEELFGKRKNNEAMLAILFAKLPLGEVCFDEVGKATMWNIL
jgi:hypothetical protein